MTLAHRIHAPAPADPLAQYHPWGTPDTPASWPGFRYTATEAGIAFEQARVIIAADGAPVYTGAPGGNTHRGGVHLAGRI